MPDNNQETHQPRQTPEERKVALQRASETIEDAIQTCGVTAVRGEPVFMQAIKMAHGIRVIRDALPIPFVEKNFMPLQNSALGFLTDKQPGGYPVEVVIDVLCEALLRGFQPVGNEFNIISGRFYGAKAGFERIVTTFPGVRDMRIELGVPHLAGDKGALVACEARWYFEGVEEELVCVDRTKDGGIDSRIPVRVNAGMGPDAILGKATRKLYARVYQRLTGCSHDVIDGDAEDALPAASLPAPAQPDKDGRRIKLGGDKKNGEAAADPAPAAPPAPTEAEKLAAEARADEAAHAGR